MIEVKNLKNEEVEYAGFTFSSLAVGFVDAVSAKKFKGVEGFEVLKPKSKKK